MAGLVFLTGLAVLSGQGDMTSYSRPANALNPVVFKTILPKRISSSAKLIGIVRDACIADAKEMQKDLERVIHTWKDDRPVIMSEVKVGNLKGGFPGYPGSFTVSAWPKNDGSRGFKKFMWLDMGTKVRYATMTNPFVAKTRPNQLASFNGKGHMLFVSKKHPRPGIKKRNFILTLRKKWDKPFAEHMKKAMSLIAIQFQGQEITAYVGPHGGLY